MTKQYLFSQIKTKGITRKYDVIVSPSITEKSTKVAEQGFYVFNVSPDANKFEIKKAIEELFNVKVDTVRTVNVLGKTKRFRGILGKRSNIKKAFVKLEAGQIIDIIAGV